MDEKAESKGTTSRLPQTDWTRHAKRLLKAEMARHDVSYKELSRLLDSAGASISEAALMTRINRGTFSVAFFLQALRAMGVKSIDISHIPSTPASSSPRKPK